MKLSQLVVILLFAAHLTSVAFALEGKMATEFADLSGKTRVAMELSSEELQELIVRCDRLLEHISTLQKSEKKIMGKKVTRLRRLFLYVLESKQAAAGKEPEKQ